MLTPASRLSQFAAFFSTISFMSSPPSLTGGGTIYILCRGKLLDLCTVNCCADESTEEQKPVLVVEVVFSGIWTITL